MKTIIDNIKRRRLEVEQSEYFYTLNGEKLFRIETKGKTGKSWYCNGCYIYNNKEQQPYGMGGATGHGWGGQIVGYLTEQEMTNYKIS